MEAEILITNYQYDLYDNLVQVSMPRAGGTQTRTFTYNGKLLLTATNPENGTVTYTYNSDQTLATKTDAKGQKIAYTYDAYHRMTMIQRSPSPGTTEDTCQRTTYYYDGAVPSGVTWTSAYSSGRMSAMQWGQTGCAIPYQFTELYTYTQAGLVTTKQLNVASYTQSFSLQTSQTYDNAGRVQTITYPAAPANLFTTGVTPTTLTTLYDGSGRPIQLTDYTVAQNNQPAYNWASSVQYGPSGELKQISYNSPYFPNGYTAANFVSETRTYNSRAQLTGISAYGASFMTYTYSAANNNGQIAQQTDAFSGEQVAYTYDGLNRLISAAASGSWGVNFSYDGFGNRTASTATLGNAPNWSQTYDVTTNRIVGFGYDANGNMTTAPNVSALNYDVENRLVSASPSGGGTESYAYSPTGKRIWKKKPDTTEEFYFYSIGGQKLGTYSVSASTATVMDTNVYFGSRMIVSRGNVVTLDRLGSVRNANNIPTPSRYFPYGEEETTTTQDRDKFATYYRDNTTGLDYAQNRYYANTLGRFLSPDPYMASVGPADPGSWNRYVYSQSDPVNYVDPTGTERCNADGCLDPNKPQPDCPFIDAVPGGDPICSGPVYGIGIGWIGGVGGGGGGGGQTPPPPQQPAQSNCTIDVSDTGTPRDGQQQALTTAVGATQLGPFTTPTSAYLAVQIQANLSGDTNGNDWGIDQTATVIGARQNTQNSPPTSVNINRPIDAPGALSPLIYSGNGTIDWLDAPGVSGFSGYYLSATFRFTSSVTNVYNHATCSVNWGFSLSDVQGQWIVAGFYE